MKEINLVKKFGCSNFKDIKHIKLLGKELSGQGVIEKNLSLSF